MLRAAARRLPLLLPRFGVANATSVSQRGALKQLYKRVHPDVLRDAEPAAVLTNEVSLQEFNAFVDCVRGLKERAGKVGAPPRLAGRYSFVFHFRSADGMSGSGAASDLSRHEVTMSTPGSLIADGADWASPKLQAALELFFAQVLHSLLEGVGLRQEAHQIRGELRKAEEEAERLGSGNASKSRNGSAGFAAGAAGSQSGSAPADDVDADDVMREFARQFGGSDRSGARHAARRAAKARRAHEERTQPGDAGTATVQGFTSALRKLNVHDSRGGQARALRRHVLRGSIEFDMAASLRDEGAAERAAARAAAREATFAALFTGDRLRVDSMLHFDTKRRAVQRFRSTLLQNFPEVHLDRPELWARLTIAIGNEWRVLRDTRCIMVPHDFGSEWLVQQLHTLVPEIATTGSGAVVETSDGVGARTHSRSTDAGNREQSMAEDDESSDGSENSDDHFDPSDDRAARLERATADQIRNRNRAWASGPSS